jgi:hypothetical protein
MKEKIKNDKNSKKLKLNYVKIRNFISGVDG